MIVGYNYKATVIDIKADKIKDINNYNVTFVKADIKSPKAIEAIKNAQDINYILVAMESDKKNLDTAIDLRRLFIKLYERKPIINIWIQNEHKKIQVNMLRNEEKTSYEIYAFGSIKDMYFDNRIVESEIEKIAKAIHRAFRPQDTEYKEYNSSEYNKRSSRASALHVKYKLYSVLRDNYTNDTAENLRLFKEVYTPEIRELLAKNEHDRWNAYMRGIGYTLVTTEEVARYYPELNDHRDKLGRRHPALVPYEKLDRVSEELRKINIDKDLRASDYNIVDNMLNDL